MYTHRSLENKDLETICTFPQSKEELHYVSPMFIYPLTPEQITNLSKGRFEPTVIIDKQTNEVVGYANIYGNDPDMNVCWLGNVIVSPKHRGQGASQYLLNVMLDKAKNNLQNNTLRLACHNTNSRGLAFYSKHGFKPFDIKITRIEEKQCITIHMSKELN